MTVTPEGETVIADRLVAVELSQAEILAPLPAHYRAQFLKSLRILVGLEDAGD